jgi:hypothetical protein
MPQVSMLGFGKMKCVDHHGTPSGLKYKQKLMYQVQNLDQIQQLFLIFGLVGVI